MACQNCNSTNDKCGCKDTALTTPIASNCVTPCIPGCEEYTNAKCVILTDGVNDIGIQPGDTLESIIQRLVLAITNPECIGLPSIDGLQLQVNGTNNIDQTLLDLVEGTGINIVDNGNGSVTISCSAPEYTVSNGLNEDPATNFKLGGYLVENTSIDGSDLYKLNLDNLSQFNVIDAGTVDIRTPNNYKQTANNHSFYKPSGPRLLNVNSSLGQMTLDGYYATTGVLYTANPAYVLSVDNLGNVLKSPYNSTVVGTITGDNGITNNTTTNVRLGGDLIQNTIITGGGSAFNLSLGDFGSTDPIGDLNLYSSNLNLITPLVAGGTAVVGKVLKLTNATNGTVEFGDPFTLTVSGSGNATFSGGVLNIPNNTGLTYTASEGLLLSTADFQLGKTSLNILPDFTVARYINGGTNTLNISGSKTSANIPFYTADTAGATFRAENTASTIVTNRSMAILGTASGNYSYGIYGSATGSSGIGVYGNAIGASGVGVFGKGIQAAVWGVGSTLGAPGSDGHAVRADNNSSTRATIYAINSSNSSSAYNLDLVRLSPSLNTIGHYMRIDVGPGTIGTVDQGGSIDFRCGTSVINNSKYQSQLKSKWIDPITATSTGKFSIAVADKGSNPIDKLSVSGLGTITFEDYGTGIFNDPAVYGLGVDANGNVVETAVSGVTASNGLTMVGNDIQLGGTLTQASTLIAGASGTTYGVQAQYINFSTNNVGIMTFNNSSDEYHNYAINSTHKQIYTTANLNISTQTNYLQVSTSGTPTQGFGAKQNLWLSSDALNSVTAMATETTWETDPAVQQLAKYTINLRETNIKENDVLSLYGNGQATLHQYGSGTFTGTLTYNLGVDASGNVVEVTQSGPLVYVGKVVGTGGGATLNEIYNNTGATFSIGNITTGYYQVNASSPVITSNTVAFVQSTQAGILTASVFGGALDIESFDLSGNPVNFVISNAIVKIEIYP